MATHRPPEPRECFYGCLSRGPSESQAQPTCGKTGKGPVSQNRQEGVWTETDNWSHLSLDTTCSQKGHFHLSKCQSLSGVISTPITVLITAKMEGWVSVLRAGRKEIQPKEP